MVYNRQAIMGDASYQRFVDACKEKISNNIGMGLRERGISIETYMEMSVCEQRKLIESIRGKRMQFESAFAPLRSRNIECEISSLPD